MSTTDQEIEELKRKIARKEAEIDLILTDTLETLRTLREGLNNLKKTINH